MEHILYLSHILTEKLLFVCGWPMTYAGREIIGKDQP